jgi:hypothetical protein
MGQRGKGKQRARLFALGVGELGVGLPRRCQTLTLITLENKKEKKLQEMKREADLIVVNQNLHRKRAVLRMLLEKQKGRRPVLFHTLICLPPISVSDKLFRK